MINCVSFLAKLKFKKKSIFPRIHRSSTVQVEARPFLPFSKSSFCPHLFCFFFVPCHSLAWVCSPDLCFDLRTRPFPETRPSPTLRSLGVWRVTSSSKPRLAEASSGERSDPTRVVTRWSPGWGWASVRGVCVCYFPVCSVRALRSDAHMFSVSVNAVKEVLRNVGAFVGSTFL